MLPTDSVISLNAPLHVVLEGVTWEEYESELKRIGNRSIRTAFDQGRMELVSPLPEHELNSTWLGRLVEMTGLERSIEVIGLGSTTFRNAALGKGLEPDKCYYVQNASRVADIVGEFEPEVHPAPDLAIEVEVTRKVIAREPIYAALKVPELWILSRKELRCRLLQDGTYVDSQSSLAFPFLEPAYLFDWCQQLAGARQTLPLLRQFQEWVRAL